LIREIDNLDPTMFGGSTSTMVEFNIYESLLYRAPDNTFQPWLAESWEVSPDGRQYTFKLRQGVKFHDGTPFNAQAVKYTMDRVHDPNAKTRFGSGAGAYAAYEATEAPDEYTAVIKLSRPWAPLLDSLSYIYRMVSPTAGQKWGEDFGQHPVGSGPFVFKEWVPNTHVTLERNPDYNWAPPFLKHQGPAYLDAIVFRQIPEAGTRTAALERGDAQVIDAVPAQDLERIKSDPKYKVIVGLVPGQAYGYSMNMRKPPTNELPVRQAMQYGINREAIVRTVFGPYQSLGANAPAYTSLGEINWGYEKKAAEVYKYDPNKAKQLLEDAGWKPGSDGIRTKDGQRLEVLMGTWENGIIEVIQSQLREIGIDIKIQVAPVVATNEAARREQVHMSPLPGIRNDPDALSSYHTRNRAGAEFTFHENPKFDEMLDAGSAATNNDERLKIYSDIQMHMMENSMYLAVHRRDSVLGARAEVEGLILDRGMFPILYDTYIRK
jgi:peptide/nickel transport system substrate-binding protein